VERLPNANYAPTANLSLLELLCCNSVVPAWHWQNKKFKARLDLPNFSFDCPPICFIIICFFLWRRHVFWVPAYIL